MCTAIFQSSVNNNSATLAEFCLYSSHKLQYFLCKQRRECKRTIHTGKFISFYLLLILKKKKLSFKKTTISTLFLGQNCMTVNTEQSLKCQFSSPEGKHGTRTFPLDFKVSQTIRQKSPIIGSGIRAGVWVKAVIIIQSAFQIRTGLG